MADSVIPPPPPGFKLKSSSDVPPPPEGFKLQSSGSDNSSPDLLGRIKGDVQNRFEKMGEASGRENMGQQSSLETLGQGAGQVAGLYSDTLGESIESAAKGVHSVASTVAPKATGFIDEKTSQLMHTIAQSKFGQEGIKAIQEGGKAWDSFKQKHPAAASDVEAIYNIATVAIPTGKGGKATEELAEQVPGKLTQVGDKLIDSGKQLSNKKSQDFVKDLISPEETKSVKMNQVGRTTEEGLLKTKVVEPSPREKAIAETVSKLPEVSSKNTIQGNYNAINDEVSREAESLQKRLASNKTTFDKNEFKQELQGVSKSLSESPVLVGDAETAANRVMQKMNQLIDQHLNTPSGLLQARKDLDKWLVSQKSKIFDAKSENAMSIAVREIRQSTNGFIAKKVPEARVLESLQKQSHLYDAMDNIRPKAAKEARDVIGRAIERVKKLVPEQLSTAHQASSSLGDVVKAGVGAVGAVGLGAQKLANSPGVRTLAGKALKMVDMAIKHAPKDAIKELRVDRAALMKIVNETKDESEEQPQETKPNPAAVQQAIDPTNYLEKKY